MQFSFLTFFQFLDQYQKQLIIKLDHDLKPNELKKLLMKIYKSFQTIGEFKSTKVNFDDEISNEDCEKIIVIFYFYLRSI